MKIIENIKNKNVNTEKIALFIRHSERYKIKKSEFGNDVLLNEAGIKKAFQFGKQLKNYKINAIYTSPIERCVQTAINIKKGYGTNIDIIKTKVLGDPGIHIYDADALGAYYFKYGFWKIFENFKNDIKVDGLHNKKEIIRLFDSFFSKKTEKTGLTIFISHDWQIAFYAYAKNIKEYTEKDWIDYLDGLIINMSVK